jgi:catechol 2,3-dioxygenase-like lactoylglutathione lyase family enzyme
MRISVFCAGVLLVALAGCQHGASAPPVAAAPVLADLAPRVMNARVTAPDKAGVEKAAAFYSEVLGVREVRRLDQPTFFEIFLNWGDTVEEAAANPAARIAVITSKEPITTASHVVLQVTDIKAVIARTEAAGGKVITQPSAAATLPISTAFIADPFGNRIELVEYRR